MCNIVCKEKKNTEMRSKYCEYLKQKSRIGPTHAGNYSLIKEAIIRKIDGCVHDYLLHWQAQTSAAKR